MAPFIRRSGALGAVLAAFLFVPSWGWSQTTLPPPDQQEATDAGGVVPQTRGPIHEAYAEPLDQTPQPGPIVPKKPPDPIAEVPPDQKPEGENVQWIPGYWAWDNDTNNFLWVSGFWRVPPPNRKWVPGHWTEVEGGWQWVPGFWAAAAQQDVQYLPTPPATLDNGPSTPAPNDNSMYVPGCWVYQSDNYLWRPGYWI